MFCNICGKQNREGAKFCRFCGNKLDSDIVCPRCGSAMDEDDLFCEKCGFKKGDTQSVKPIDKNEYPVFESETPIEYGDEKPIIEEYEVTPSNKTIEDYCFSDYEEVPDMMNPYEFSKDKYEIKVEEKPAEEPKKEETFYKEDKKKDNDTFYKENKKEPLYKEDRKQDKEIFFKEDKKKDKKIIVEKQDDVSYVPKSYNGKGINVMLLIVSVVIIAMVFLPMYSSRTTGEYVRNSFAFIKKNNFMNYISFFQFLFGKSTLVFSTKIDKLFYLFIILGLTIILICMIKIFIFAAKNLKDQKYNSKYDKPFVVCLVTAFILYVACNINSIPAYFVLSLSLAVLLFRYFYEKKFNLSEFIKTAILLFVLGLFLVSLRNIGLNGAFEGYSSWSKFSIGRYFDLVGAEASVSENYIRDLISFLGWATSVCLAFSVLFAVVVLIKIVKAIYTDERDFMPIISMSISVCSIILAFLFWVFAKSNCNKHETITNCGFNAWTVVALLAGLALCAFFGMMNYTLNKAKKKEKLEAELKEEKK